MIEAVKPELIKIFFQCCPTGLAHRDWGQVHKKLLTLKNKDYGTI